MIHPSLLVFTYVQLVCSPYHIPYNKFFVYSNLLLVLNTGFLTQLLYNVPNNVQFNWVDTSSEDHFSSQLIS
ncbi:hypothetical protein DFH28DRAFT_961002 [Melampsora americana]|nr:hypothetical protein DFH28DRAFT_961002 [Melampsora americana]